MYTSTVVKQYTDKVLTAQEPHMYSFVCNDGCQAIYGQNRKIPIVVKQYTDKSSIVQGIIAVYLLEKLILPPDCVSSSSNERMKRSLHPSHAAMTAIDHHHDDEGWSTREGGQGLTAMNDDHENKKGRSNSYARSGSSRTNKGLGSSLASSV